MLRSCRTYLKALVAFLAMVSTGRAVLVENGLILNLQADNIDGNNNAGMVDGTDLTSWVDVLAPGGHQTQDNITPAGAVAYLDPTTVPTPTSAPSYVALTTNGRPGVRFVRSSAGAVGDALGTTTPLAGLDDAPLDFTAFIVADLTDAGTQRMLQMGRTNGANGRVVGLGNNGFRFNNGSKTYGASSNFGPASAGAHLGTYSMTLTDLIANANYSFDGAPGTSPVTDSSNFTTLNSTAFNQGFAIGAGQDGSSKVNDATNGIIYAILVYNRVLSASEVADVESFLTDKFVTAIPEASAWAALSLTAGACGLVWQVRRRLQR